jgi:hypothetical protein
MANEVSIDCGRLRRDYIRAVKNIFGKDVSLAKIDPEDLSLISHFQHHSVQCPMCTAWEINKRAIILGSLDKE